MKSKNKYSLPIKTRYMAVNDAHLGNQRYAIDFMIPFKEKIIASADGEVIFVKDSSRKGGINLKYNGNMKYLNYIKIRHANNETSVYAHIDYKGSLVKIGQKVKVGQPIAKGIGINGFTSAPHLHFAIERDSNNKKINNTIKINWKIFNKPKILGKNFFGKLMMFAKLITNKRLMEDIKNTNASFDKKEIEAFQKWAMKNI